MNIPHFSTIIVKKTRHDYLARLNVPNKQNWLLQINHFFINIHYIVFPIQLDGFTEFPFHEFGAIFYLSIDTTTARIFRFSFKEYTQNYKESALIPAVDRTTIGETTTIKMKNVVYLIALNIIKIPFYTLK